MGATVAVDEAMRIALAQAHPAVLEGYLRQRVAEIEARGGVSASTAASYRQAVKHAGNWARYHGVDIRNADADQVAALVLCAGDGLPPFSRALAPSTIRQVLSAMRLALHLAGVPSDQWHAPIVHAALREVARSAAMPQGADPLRLPDLRAVISVIAPTQRGAVIRACLLVGYSGALRVAELAALQLGDLRRNGPDVMATVIRKRHNQPQTVRLMRAADTFLCPVAALGQLAAAPRSQGRLFAPARTIQGWVAVLAHRAGLQGRYSPHSLRHGWATDAATAGIPLSAIQAHLGHATAATTLGYASHAELRCHY